MASSISSTSSVPSPWILWIPPNCRADSPLKPLKSPNGRIETGILQNWGFKEGKKKKMKGNYVERGLPSLATAHPLSPSDS
ncbi:hypothetical protein SDJN03_05509, partial [Cucurbita argyrosperma subsp. sororia]